MSVGSIVDGDVRRRVFYLDMYIEFPFHLPTQVYANPNDVPQYKFHLVTLKADSFHVGVGDGERDFDR